MNLPNKITLARIALIPVFVILFCLDGILPYSFLIAGIVFVLAASTDFLDGYIARKRHLVTNLGKFLDPIADKVLISTGLILLLAIPPVFHTAYLEGWGLLAAGVCSAIILARELIVSGFRMVAAEKKVVLAADKLGKIKTVTQDAALAVLIITSSFLYLGKVADVFALIGFVLLALAAVLTVASGVNYIVRNRQVLKEEKEESEVSA